MTTTFKVRIEALEKKLNEYQIRLDLEEKRRIILENWIHLNFDFDVSSELEITETQNGRRGAVKRENRIKRKTKFVSRDFDPRIPSSDAGANPDDNQVHMVIEPTTAHDHPDSDNFVSVSGESEDSDSDCGVKKKPRIRRRRRKANINQNRSISVDRPFYVDHNFEVPQELKRYFRYLKTFEASPGEQEHSEGECVLPECGRIIKIRGKNFFTWRRHVQDIHDVKLPRRLVGRTPSQGGKKVHRSKCKGSTFEIPSPTNLLETALTSIGVETIEPSNQNNSNASVNVTVTHFPN